MIRCFYESILIEYWLIQSSSYWIVHHFSQFPFRFLVVNRACLSLPSSCDLRQQRRRNQTSPRYWVIIDPITLLEVTVAIVICSGKIMHCLFRTTVCTLQVCVCMYSPPPTVRCAHAHLLLFAVRMPTSFRLLCTCPPPSVRCAHANLLPFAVRMPLHMYICSISADVEKFAPHVNARKKKKSGRKSF